MKVTLELWRRLEPLLDAALEMEAPAREAWLAATEAAHPDLAPVLGRLLAHHERAERLGELETVAGMVRARRGVA